MRRMSFCPRRVLLFIAYLLGCCAHAFASGGAPTVTVTRCESVGTSNTMSCVPATGPVLANTQIVYQIKAFDPEGEKLSFGPVFPSPTISSVVYRQLGDVDETGLIQGFDATKVSNFLAGTGTLTESQRWKADVDQNTVINSNDATLINQIVAKTAPEPNIYYYSFKTTSSQVGKNFSIPFKVSDGTTTVTRTATLSVVSSIPVNVPGLNPAQAGDGKVTLTWNTVTNAVGYKVKYGTASGNYTTTIDVGNNTTYNVNGLINGTQYYFVVVAYSISTTSANSNQVSAKPDIVEANTLFVKNVDYNAAGQIIKIEYGNGVTTTYTYDPLNLRLRRIYTINISAQVLQDLNYAYDSVGNILSITDAVNTASQSFQYDELSRLTKATGSYGTKSYVYDKIGNIVQKDGLTYGYGTKPHAVTSLSNGTTFEYDANGNMVKKTETGNIVTQYSYDTENRLTKVDKNGQNIALYYYDGDGGRTKTIVNGVITTFVGALYEETSTRKTRYVFLGDTRLASISNGNILYYHGDHLGSANVLTDAGGIKKELIEYEPFGKITRDDRSGTSNDIARYYFTGQRFDDETGLYFYNARYYDASLGRFLTSDLVVPRPGNPQAFNRYSYASNNPVTYLEDGNGWFIPFIFAAIKGAAVGAAVGAATAGITGGDIGNGALFGAIGGGAFSGLSSVFSSGAKFAMTGTSNVSLVGKTATAFNILGTAVSGAGAGASMAAINGSDIGLGALAGLAGSMAGYFGAHHLAPSAGHIFGNLASAAVNGNDLDRAAYLGFLDSSVGTTIEYMIPQPTIGSQGTPEGGDLIFYKAGLDPGGLFLSFLQGKPISHVAVAQNATRQIDSHVDGGVNIRDIDFGRQGRLVKWAGAGNKKFVDLAVQYGKVNAFQYGLGPGREVCSTFCGRVATETGLSIPGFSPSSQFHNLQNIPYFGVYGVQRP